MIFFRNGIAYQVKLNHWIPRTMNAIRAKLKKAPHEAITLGRTIFVAGAVCSASLHGHEFRHVQQFDREPWLFYPKFLWAARTGYPKAPLYDTGNLFEIDAYRLELNPSYVATFMRVAA
jgi:hypothetical protein